MFCAKCGTQNDEGVVFCKNCGQKLDNTAAAPSTASNTVNMQSQFYQPQMTNAVPNAQPQMTNGAAPVQPQMANVATPVQNQTTPVSPQSPLNVVKVNTVKPKNKVAGKFDFKKLKPFLFAAAGVIVAVAAIIIVVNIVKSKSSADDISDFSFARYHNVEDEETCFIINGKLLKDTIPDYAYTYTYSGSTLIVYNDDYEYFVVTSDGIEELGEDIYKIRISYDDSTIIYLNDDDELMSYTVSSGKENKIEEDVDYFAVSPSGKAVLYRDDDDTLYAYDGKKSVELADDAYPIGLSDDCKYIYYYDDDYDLYVTNLKADETKISSIGDSSFYFNKDCTQILFYGSNGGWYVSDKGGDKTKISSSWIEPISVDSGLKVSYCSNYTEIYGISSFSDRYYYSDDSLVYVDKKFESEKIIKDDLYYDYDLSDDMKTLYYIDDDSTLYSYQIGSKSDPVKIKSDVSSVYALPDGKGAYFEKDDCLYYVSGSKDPEKIASDIYSYDVTFDGYCLFMTDYDYNEETATLYSSKNGGDKEKIVSDCSSFSCYDNFTIYIDNYEYEYDSYSWTSTYSFDINVSTSGVNFSKVIESAGYKD